jgi:hypothetical protein
MPAAAVSIETLDTTVPERLLGVAPAPGLAREIHNAGVLLFRSESPRGSIPHRYDFIVEFGSGNGAGLLANWLWTELHGHAATLRIGDEDVAVQHSEIKRALLAAAEDGSGA